MPDPLSPESCARARAERLRVDDDEMLELRADIEREQRCRDVATREWREATRIVRLAQQLRPAKTFRS